MMSSAGIPFVHTGSYPTRRGNAVRPLIDGEPAFRRICEAVDAAHQRVWATITFMWADFAMPDGRGSALDVLDRAAERGIEVRLICWRPDAETAGLARHAFWGSPDHIALLARRRSGVHIRWDRAHPGFCQHQKSWLIDAGALGATAFVGGINLNPHSMVAPGHVGDGHNHDVYLELAGPSTVDVHHNFVQRWNEASERLLDDGRWGAASDRDLAFPDRVPAERGGVTAQIQRTTHPGRYRNGQSTPGGVSFDIASGEQANFDQYQAAIDAACRSIYIENQQIDVPAIVEALERALQRGVQVIVVIPGNPVPTSPPGLEALAALHPYATFMAAGLAGVGADGRRTPVYVHAKVMLVDDGWATVGSCNLHQFSLFGNGEMNVAFSDPTAVRAFRCALLQEHLAQDTAALDDRDAFQVFHRVAHENRKKLDAGDAAWQGLAFALERQACRG